MLRSLRERYQQGSDQADFILAQVDVAIQEDTVKWKGADSADKQGSPPAKGSSVGVSNPTYDRTPIKTTSQLDESIGPSTLDELMASADRLTNHIVPARLATIEQATPDKDLEWIRANSMPAKQDEGRGSRVPSANPLTAMGPMTQPLTTQLADRDDLRNPLAAGEDLTTTLMGLEGEEEGKKEEDPPVSGLLQKP